SAISLSCTSAKSAYGIVKRSSRMNDRSSGPRAAPSPFGIRSAPKHERARFADRALRRRGGRPHRGYRDESADVMKRVFFVGAVVVILVEALGGCGGGGEVIGVGADNDASADVADGAKTEEVFAVGGTVTGLIGTGLVLQNNGADNVTVNANGV